MSSTEFKESSNSDFIKAIIDVVSNRGHGLAPLIGSGISAPSGILMGQDFTDFLGYTVYRVIYEEWDIPRNGWPKYPEKSEVDKAKKMLCAEYRRICNEHYADFKENKEDLVEKFISFDRSKETGTSKRPEIEELFQESLRDLSIPLIPSILCDRALFLDEQRRQETYERAYRRHPSQDWQAPTSQAPSSEEYLREKAIRSLHDWRATLAFLSSVNIVEVFHNSEPKKRAILVDPDTSVIDSFNVHITRDKQPNLSHLMIAHLARPLRSRILLTTNFDALLENSFDNLNEPLQALEVSSRGRLPSFRTVRSQNSLVKLHGSLTETRADFSLDDPPSAEDKETFTAYLCGDRVNFQPHEFAPAVEVGLQHLLVMGYSGRDQRTIQLIKHALDSHPKLRVFWICHSTRDSERVQELFNEKSYRVSNRIMRTVSDRPDLLLYELYQKLTYSLPGGGFSFQYSPNVPPDHKDYHMLGDKMIAEKEGKNISAVEHYIKEPDDAIKFCHPLVISSGSGVTASTAKLFDKLKSASYNPLWLELEDYSSPTMLFFDVFQIISLKLGYYQLDHTALLPLEFPRDPNGLAQFRYLKLPLTNNGRIDLGEVGDHVDRFIKYLSLTPSRWPIFLYARNGAGGCADLSPKYWSQDDFRDLEDIIKTLAQKNFKVVYFPYDKKREIHDEGFRINGSNQAGCTDVLDKQKEVLRKRQHDAKESIGRKALAQRKEFLSYRDEGRHVPLFCPASVQKWNPDDKKEDRIHEVVGNAPKVPVENSAPFKNIIFQVKATRESDEYEYYYSQWEGFAKSKPRPGAFNSTFSRIIGIENPTSTGPIDEVWLDLSGGVKSLVSASDPALPSSGENKLQRLQFLYGLTLFRQSRHIAALLSDATYPCPYRFNYDGKDNDKIRYETVDKWISSLQEKHLLWTKSGGYYWCFRDCRLGLQQVLEELVDIPLPSAPERGRQGYDFLGQMRARTHYWIGGWYQKAFSSTGHYLPLIEALYHRIEAVRFSPFAKYGGKSLEADELAIYHYRIALARQSLYEAVKSLRWGRDSLKFWFSGSDGNQFDIGVLDDLIAHLIYHQKLYGVGVKGMAEEEFKRRSLDFKWLQDDVARLKTEFQSVQYAIRDESGFSTGKLLLFQGASESPELNVEFKSQSVPESPEDELTELRNIVESSLCRRIDLSPFKVIDDYLSTNTNLDKKIREWALRWIKDFEEEQLDSGLRSNPRQGQDKLCKMIWVLSEVAYYYVKEAKRVLQYQVDEIPYDFQPMEIAKYLPDYVHVSETDSKPRDSDPILKRWSVVSALCWICIDLCRNLDPCYSDFEVSSKIKCNTLYGLALGHLSRFYEAHRRLTEAQALMPRGRQGFKGHEFACLHLRRAEVYLNQAEYEISETPHIPAKLNTRYFAFIDDAWAAIERAEKALSGFSHSSLWWGKLYTLKLRAYSLFRELPSEFNYNFAWEVARRTLPFRRRLQYDEVIRQIISRALLTKGNSFRRLQILGYYLQILIIFRNLGMPELNLSEFSILRETKKIQEELSIMNEEEKKLYETVLEKFAECKLEHFLKKIDKVNDRVGAQENQQAWIENVKQAWIGGSNEDQYFFGRNFDDLAARKAEELYGTIFPSHT